MKSARSSTSHQNKQQGGSHRAKPDVRDDLDSRKEKEATQVSTSRIKGKKNRKNKV